MRDISGQATPDDSDAPAIVQIDVAGAAFEVCRFLPDTDDPGDPAFAEQFRSDKDKGREPSPREQRHPILHEGISVFRTLEQARQRWQRIADRVGADRVRMGQWIATLRLEPGNGFAYEDSDDADGHLYAWGEELKLAQAVTDITPVQAPSNG